jgi:hypothetical protein
MEMDDYLKAIGDTSHLDPRIKNSSHVIVYRNTGQPHIEKTRKYMDQMTNIA